MKKILSSIITTLLISSNTVFASDYKAVDEFSKESFNINSENYLKNEKLDNSEFDFSEKDLLKVLINTKQYFEKFSNEDPIINRVGFLESADISLNDILKTIDYLIEITQEDIKEKRSSRLKNIDFINENFRVIRWYPYNPKDKTQTEKIRITKYAIFTHEGSKTKTKFFNIPLYALKSDDMFYKKYTKQDVLSGIFEKKGKEFGKAQSLVYLTREGLEEALMEGTLLVKYKDGKSEFFNVDRNNGIAYVKGLDRKKQKRYWYFKQVNSINGYGNKIENRIKVEPAVTFAGDIFNIGLGRIVALQYDLQGKKKTKIGIIADTGGAFLPNLHQLDFLAGIFKTRQDFINYSKNLPPYVNVSFLIKK
ncbi:MAG: hypothetical protein U0354_00090 [Candidatus Sericytochromatia bacterium]